MRVLMLIDPIANELIPTEIRNWWEECGRECLKISASTLVVNVKLACDLVLFFFCSSVALVNFLTFSPADLV